MNESDKAIIQNMGRLSHDLALLRVALYALRDITPSPEVDSVVMTLVAQGFNLRVALADLRKEAGIPE